jgi:hypothetical protein
MRLKVSFFIRLKVLLFLAPLSGDRKLKKHYLDFRSHEKFVSHKYDLEIKSLNNPLKLLSPDQSCVYKIFQAIKK